MKHDQRFLAPFHHHTFVIFSDVAVHFRKERITKMDEQEKRYSTKLYSVKSK